MSTYREPFVCTGCGHRDMREVVVYGDYDPPNEIVKVGACPVCISAPFKTLKVQRDALVAFVEEVANNSRLAAVPGSTKRKALDLLAALKAAKVRP